MFSFGDKLELVYGGVRDNYICQSVMTCAVFI